MRWALLSPSPSGRVERRDLQPGEALQIEEPPHRQGSRELTGGWQVALDCRPAALSLTQPAVL